jgi:hypothetical protein
VDWGLALAVALGLVAASPFLTRPGLPHHTDAELHVYRAAELGHLLRAGAFYPRWAPNLYLGYGYPIFNYYAPFTYYLANLFDLLPDVDIVGGVKAVFVLGLVLASVGAYLLGREISRDAAAGLVAAASFTFAPYVVFIDPHARGDLAEHFAICLLPLTFYFFHRLSGAQSGGWRYGGVGRGAFAGSVLTLAALVFSHNLLGLVSAGLLFAYWVWQAAVGPASGRWARAGWGALAFALAAALIAFFWLPALLEWDAVRLDVIGPGHFDFREHFLSLGELLAPSRILDWGATAPRFWHNLGLAQWLLALPSLVVVALSVKHTLTRRHGDCSSPPLPLSPAPYLLMALALIFLMLPASVRVWECIPGMAYLQFPWRLLGPANLMLAVCAASGLTLLPGGCRRSPVAALVLLTVLLLALPVLYPLPWDADFGGTTPADIIAWEQKSLAYGTTSTGDFVPTGAALVLMRAEPALLASYARSVPVDRVNRATLPEGAVVELVAQGPLYDRFIVSTPHEFVFRLFTFYFPGWRATVDGKEVAIEVAGPEGFITFWVPAGKHDVLVRFGDTPARTLGWIVSAIGIAAFILILALLPNPKNLQSAICNLQLVLCFGGAILLFVLLKNAVIDPRDGWLRYTSPPGEVWAAQNPLRANFGGQIELLGYDLPRRRVRPGDCFPVTLYWRALMPMAVNYQSFLHLARPLDVVWGQEDHLNPGGLPTTRWPLDRYVWDEYEICVSPDVPPGEYMLNAGIYSLTGNYRLPRYDGAGQVVGDSIVIATVIVE